MSQNNKLLYIYRPHNARSVGRLEFMPFAFSPVIMLGSLGWAVDLHVWQDKDGILEALLPETVNIVYHEDPPPSRWNRLREPILEHRLCHGGKYVGVIGVGQPGAHYAGVVARRTGVPFILLNDEFPSSWQNTNWTVKERQAAALATLVVVPDLQRAPHALDELGLEPSRPVAALLNAPCQVLKPSQRDWRADLSIDKHKFMFLHTGSVMELTRVGEILAMAPLCRKDAVFVIQNGSRRGSSTRTFRRERPYLELPGRVFWIEEDLSDEDLAALLSQCSGSFALYTSPGPNEEFMGFASGKLIRSIQVGTPVLVSDHSSLRIVEKSGCGLCVRHPADIPSLVDQILRDLPSFQSRCRAFATRELDYRKVWGDFAEKLRAACGLDLGCPSGIFITEHSKTGCDSLIA